MPLNAACFVSGTGGSGFLEAGQQASFGWIPGLAGTLTSEQLGPPRERAETSPVYGRALPGQMFSIKMAVGESLPPGVWRSRARSAPGAHRFGVGYQKIFEWPDLCTLRGFGLRSVVPGKILPGADRTRYRPRQEAGREKVGSLHEIDLESLLSGFMNIN